MLLSDRHLITPIASLVPHLLRKPNWSFPKNSSDLLSIRLAKILNTTFDACDLRLIVLKSSGRTAIFFLSIGIITLCRKTFVHTPSLYINWHNSTNYSITSPRKDLRNSARIPSIPSAFRLLIVRTTFPHYHLPGFELHPTRLCPMNISSWPRACMEVWFVTCVTY